ncbi:hypothetical protein WICMUC_005618 [Wickerhamomyces mucosus]|uniref:aminodeoxychorismate synthase n=1 Tax=Wickerhamomyces mucosus TaxID=1378264 RepID=A0A9P8P7T8_9ASCO|nr:hypothetical protein WICMUC_005618 [Wickerhamomyces mucosus]
MTILLVDSYDSFTFNLRSLIETATGEKVITIHNDTLDPADLGKYTDYFSSIIVGPGPGHPNIPSDVGLIPDLFNGTISKNPIPILGICLGFQALCLSQGCEINRLDSIKHGQVYPVSHTNTDRLFHNIPQDYKCVRYHSLYVPELNDQLVKLAVTQEIGSNEEIIMSARHVDKPWYGVQYHPESICSEAGEQLIKNFASIARKFNEKRPIKDYNELVLSNITNKIKYDELLPNSPLKEPVYFNYQELETTKSPIEMCDLLNSLDKEFIFLNSASFPGDWSIIALPSKTSTYITHSTECSSEVVLEINGSTKKETLSGTIWEYLSKFMSDKLCENQQKFPFIGGLLGIFSYEEGQFIDTTNLPKITSDNIPDTKLVYVEDCILVDQTTNKIYLTSLNPSFNFTELKELILKTHILKTDNKSIQTKSIIKPDRESYAQQFRKCQEYLSSGDSYELCLTSDTKISIPSSYKPWDIYKTLTSKNPSPYSAFLKFSDCILISSSPERFMKWDDNFCELRPIKGTVKKTPTIDFEKASSILNTPKEIGENLMIVDLIRHDLYNFLDKVKVQKLMQVEEYSTVYQLVSVIQGLFCNEYKGIDVLSKSLPPGSMTGAPKKRSVEILQQLENRRRGFYSGICGYWSIDNKSDWSVIIRSIFHYVNDLENNDEEQVWRIGAGGAITVLSDLEGEWQELLTKLDSALQTFT